MININDEIKIIKDLAGEYKLGEKGWNSTEYSNIQSFSV